MLKAHPIASRSTGNRAFVRHDDGAYSTRKVGCIIARMGATSTTIAVQRLLDDLGTTDSPSDDPVVRALLARSVDRMNLICSRLLHGNYPRLMRRPAYLDTNDLVGALVSRLLRALQEVKPRSTRQFFGLVNKHLRWELNSIARRIDLNPAQHGYAAEPVELAPPSAADDSATLQRILAIIEALPDAEREVFELVRIQGLTHAEAAEVLQVASKTIQRRLRRGLLLLSESLGDLVADDGTSDSGDAMSDGEPSLP